MKLVQCGCWGEASRHGGENAFYYVGCIECGCSVGPYRKSDMADEAWNRAMSADLRQEMEKIAKQYLSSELDPIDQIHADYKGAYDTIVKIAKVALKGGKP